MPEKKEGPMQDMIDRGNLSLQVTSTIGLLPVENARISISYTGEDSVVEEITTDNSGRTEAVSLPAPPLEWSLDAEQTNRPYAELNLQITAPGYQPVTIEGSELLADATALQQVGTDGRDAADRKYRDPGSYIIWRISAQDPRGRDQTDGGNRRDRIIQSCDPGIRCGT